jgi:ABC-type dipeptide/oligopeptide/nickel transport system ATPase component
MSSGESRELGRALGRLLKAGDLIALYGDLGSGKTVLAQGISTGLGYDGYVSSPSFVIVNEYAGFTIRLRSRISGTASSSSATEWLSSSGRSAPKNFSRTRGSTYGFR